MVYNLKLNCIHEIQLRNQVKAFHTYTTQKVQLDLSFVRSIKKLLQLNRWCFGFGIGIIKTGEAKNSKFTELIWRTRHLKPADFSTLNFQVLIVRLSQDLVSVHIFESENHLEKRIFFNLIIFFTIKHVETHQIYQNCQFWR